MARSRVPQVKKTEKGWTISHRERVGEISATTAWGVATYPLNPGLSDVFPWLSGEARGFERYRFKHLRFEFVSATSEYTHGDGKLLYACDYDSKDPAPTSVTEIGQYAGNGSTRPFKDSVFVVDMNSAFPAGPQQRRNIRTGPVIGQQDCGNFYLATTGMVDTNVIGDLFVDYSVILETPQKATVTPSSRNTSVYLVDGDQALATGVAEYVDWSLVGHDGLGLGTPVSGGLVLPPGNYLLHSYINAYGGAASGSYVVSSYYAIDGTIVPYSSRATNLPLTGSATVSHDTTFLLSTTGGTLTNMATITCGGSLHISGTYSYFMIECID